jgi:hypothetical protein
MLSTLVISIQSSQPQKYISAHGLTSIRFSKAPSKSGSTTSHSNFPGGVTIAVAIVLLVWGMKRYGLWVRNKNRERASVVVDISWEDGEGFG